MPEVALRPMQAEDIPAVMGIEHLAFSQPWREEDYRREAESSVARYVVLTQDGVVTAYGGLWLLIDEAHITTLAVHPDAQRKGYGVRVMEALLRAALDVDVRFVTLEVRAGNAPAQALYKKLGFKKAGVQPAYYEDGEDAWILINPRPEVTLYRLENAHEPKNA